jgi:soluble lytic murein transglycosylase-like protein
MSDLKSQLAGILLSLALLFTASAAQADIYGYVDAQGEGHFSPEKIDDRYQLFVRGTGAFDSNRLRDGNDRIAPPPAAKPALVRYLSQHPNLKKYEALLNQAAKDFSLEPALLKAVMAAESGFNPHAVSAKGAVGLMQLMPGTAQRYGLQANRQQSIQDKLTDPKTNIRLGARYLRDLQKMFTSRLELVIASYNAGEGAVQKYKNQIPPYPETRNYVQIVTQFYRIYQPLYQPDAAAAAALSTAPSRIHLTMPARRNMPE